MYMKKARAYLMIFGLLSIYCTSNEPKNDTKIIEPVKQEVDKLQEVSKTRIEETKKSASLEINIGNIKFKEISLYTSKESILETLGKPNKIIEPKYDCGPFSEAWQEMKFFQYSYEGMNFIVVLLFQFVFGLVFFIKCLLNSVNFSWGSIHHNI